MKIQETETGRGVLQYEIFEEKVRITGYRGKDLSVVIPEQIDGLPVTVIGKKAFLSNKMIRQVTLPGRTEQIDDWAFAFCTRLTTVVCPYRTMKIGQGIFKECVQLEQIADKYAHIQDKEHEDIAALLAAAIVKFDAFYLFDFETVGTAEWLAQWDKRLLARIETDDSEGFSKMLLCGEEDYGSRENDPEHYREQQRRNKVRIAMLRLMHDFGLSGAVKARLQEYLLEHIKGKPSEETWRVVLEEHGDEREYYQFLIDFGCVTEDNYQAMINDMGESHTEMKAFLMRHHTKELGKKDVFAAFEL